MSNFVIREITKQDLPELLRLVRELAVYEEMENELVAGVKEYEKSLFEENFAKALILELEGKMIGYAIYFYTFSSFLGSGGMYLEDIYIKQEFRKRGYAKAVFRYLAHICKEKNLKRLEWVCLHENQLGIDFYERLNSCNMSKKWRTYRLSGADLEALLSL